MTRNTRLESGEGKISVSMQDNNDLTHWCFKFRVTDTDNLPILP